MTFNDFIIIKHIYFPWLNVIFLKKLHDRNQYDDSQCMLFLDSIKHVRQKHFQIISFHILWQLTFQISTTTKKRLMTVLTIMKLSVLIIH